MSADHPVPSGESETLRAALSMCCICDIPVPLPAGKCGACLAVEELARLTAEVERLTAERDAWRDPVLDGWAVYSEIPESGRYPMGADGVSLVLDAVARLARRALTTEGGDRE